MPFHIFLSDWTFLSISLFLLPFSISFHLSFLGSLSRKFGIFASLFNDVCVVFSFRIPMTTFNSTTLRRKMMIALVMMMMGLLKRFEKEGESEKKDNLPLLPANFLQIDREKGRRKIFFRRLTGYDIFSLPCLSLQR